MFASAAQRLHESCTRREFVDLLLVLLMVLLRVAKAYAVSYDWSRGHEQNHPSLPKGVGKLMGKMWATSDEIVFSAIGNLHSTEMTENTGI